MIKLWISVIACSVLTSITALSGLKEITFAPSKQKGGKTSSAVGVLVDNEGTLATVALIGYNPEAATVKDAAGKSLALKLIAHDPVSRLTLLKLPENQRAGVTIIKSILKDTSSLKPGDTLKADPSDASKLSRMVSFMRRHNGRILPLTFIRVNHPDKDLKPGGPVMTSDGKLAGFFFQYSGEDQSFYMLPIEVLAHLKTATANGKKHRPCWIGVSMDHLSDAPVVIGVRPAAPARKAGILKGDVIISIAGKNVSTYGQVVNAFFYMQAGKSIEFKLIRGTELKTLNVVPEVNPLYK